jgi:exosortase A-associated hydrolase 2
MAALSAAARAQPFFLPARTGQRFCLYHPPAGECRGALVYLHPFGDEMNKARRMAALQSRALAELGYGVLQIDLYGCGDSSGDFGEARWDIWKDDVAVAAAWLEERTGHAVGLWGLRLGALLALDCARTAAYSCLLLWQPLHGGSAFLTQFLRMKMANQMLAEGGDTGGGTKQLREALRGGEVLEIGGYDLAPAMADAIEALDTIALAPHGCPVLWFEIQSAPGRALAPAAARITAAWHAAGVALHVEQVHCLQFWATQEIAECPELLAATSAVFALENHEV